MILMLFPFPPFIPKGECKHSWLIALFVALCCLFVFGVVIVVKVAGE